MTLNSLDEQLAGDPQIAALHEQGVGARS